MSETPRDTSEENEHLGKVIRPKEFNEFSEEKIKETREKIEKALTSHFRRPPEAEIHHHPDCTVKLISLSGTYGHRVIERAFDRLLAGQGHPSHMLLQPLDENKEAIMHAASKVGMSKIPCTNVIASPYSPGVARAAKLRLKDALIAIILADSSRYSTNPDGIESTIARKFKANSEDLDAIYKEIFRDFEKNKRKAISSFNKLLQTSNDISWHWWKAMRIKGKVMAMVGAEHAKIFTRVFRPTRQYSPKELDRVVGSVAESEILGRIRMPKSPQYQQEIDLRKHLRKYPHDELARKRLDDLKKNTPGR